MKYILRHWVQFLSVKFCFCLFCWHITGKLLTAIAVWRKSVHAKLFWRTVETSFYSGSAEKIFPLKTFTLVHSITLTVMRVLTESVVPLVAFLVKLENWKMKLFIEMNSGKARKALRGFLRNYRRVASIKSGTFTHETVTNPMWIKRKTCHE